MRIKDVELLKKWIMDYIHPICAADPEALAKYVIALLKKDQSLPELKQKCIEQLDTFLTTKTTEFVNNLLDVLTNESYLKIKSVSAIIEKEKTPDSPTPQTTHHTEAIVEEHKVSDEHQDRSGSDNESRDKDSSGSSRRLESKHESERYKRSNPPRFDRYSSREQRFHGYESRGSRFAGSGHRHDMIAPYKAGGRRYGSYRGSRPRCRDFYEKGVCINGSSCPLNHGQDAMVLMNNNSAASFSSFAAAMAVASAIPNFGNSKKSIANFLPVPANFLASQQISESSKGATIDKSASSQDTEYSTSVRPNDVEPEMYNPENPDISARPETYNQDEKPHMSSNADSSSVSDQNTSNTLQIHRIPAMFMNYASFNTFFGSFGKIIDIQLTFNGNPQSALITFSTHQEANRAFTSPHAIFGNRFVRMNWYRPGRERVDNLHANRRFNNKSQESGSKSEQQLGLSKTESEKVAALTYVHPELEKKLEDEKSRRTTIKQEAEDKSKELIQKYDSEARTIMKMLKSPTLNEEKRANLTSLLNNILQQKDQLLFPKKYSDAASKIQKTRAIIKQQLSKKIDNRPKCVKFSWAADAATESSIKNIVSEIIQRSKASNNKDFTEKDSDLVCMDDDSTDFVSGTNSSGIVRGTNFSSFIAIFPSHYLAKAAYDEAKDILGLSADLWHDETPVSDVLPKTTYIHPSSTDDSTRDSFNSMKNFYDGGLSPDVMQESLSSRFLVDDDDRSWKR